MEKIKKSYQVFKNGFIELEKPLAKEALFILSMGLSIFFYMALFSFSPFDSSALSASYPSPEFVKNLSGKLGAHVSASLIYWFGYAAFLVPAIFLVNALAVIFANKNLLRFSFLAAWGFLLTSIATTLKFILPYYMIQSVPYPSGGVVGSYVYGLAVKYLGIGGSVVILSCSILLLIGFILEDSFILTTTKWMKAISAKIPKVSLRLPRIRLPRIKIPVLKLKQNKPQILELTRETLPREPAVDSGVTNGGHEPQILIDEAPIQEDNASSFFNKRRREKKTISLNIFGKSASKTSIDKYKYQSIGKQIVKILADFGIEGNIIGYQPGPVVTVYEFQPAVGIKQSKILGLIDDISLALKVESIFMHPVRGKRAIGIQVPNPQRETVMLGDLFDNLSYKQSRAPLHVAMGKGINGDAVYADLATMPHLLMAGATGSGKSMAINSILVNILYRTSPDDVKLLLVDPKMLELSVYDGIPHLLMPVITEPSKAAIALQWAVTEMERRYSLMHHLAVRNIDSFNEAWSGLSEIKKQAIREKMRDSEIDRLPMIVLIIDELADLMMTAPKEVESVIQRLAQKARASGIHMVLATQRPSVDILTGVIKANLPCRVAFQVVSKHDSRTILDQQGAEKLLGKGDMLFMRPGVMRIERIQGPYVSDNEVQNLVANIKEQYTCEYDDKLIDWIEKEVQRLDGNSEFDLGSGDIDEKFSQACQIAQSNGVISASFLQRQLKIGYNRAARIVEQMEQQGLVDKADGVKPRKWLAQSY